MALPLSYTRVLQRRTKSPQSHSSLKKPSRGNQKHSPHAPYSIGHLRRQVGGAGFEPAKAVPSDLQSDPFDRSGNPPDLRCALDSTHLTFAYSPERIPTKHPNKIDKLKWRENNDLTIGRRMQNTLRASGGVRTHDLLITNQLLCQLSYAGGPPACQNQLIYRTQKPLQGELER